MTVHVHRLLHGSTRLGHIYTEWVPTDTLDHSLQLEVLQGEDPNVAIVAGSHDPVLLFEGSNAERSYVIDLLHIEFEYHVGVDFFWLVFEVADDVVEGSVGEDFARDQDAFLELLILL